MKSMIYIVILIAVGLIAYLMLTNNHSSTTMESENLKETVTNNPGTVIDVRTRAEYEDGHLTIADYNYDVLSGEFEESLDNLDKDETYYLYCRSGSRSEQATKIMKENGFENVHNIGGFGDLVNKGFEAE